MFMFNTSAQFIFLVMWCIPTYWLEVLSDVARANVTFTEINKWNCLNANEIKNWGHIYSLFFLLYFILFCFVYFSTTFRLTAAAATIIINSTNFFRHVIITIRIESHTNMHTTALVSATSCFVVQYNLILQVYFDITCKFLFFYFFFIELNKANNNEGELEEERFFYYFFYFLKSYLHEFFNSFVLFYFYFWLFFSQFLQP